MYIAIDVLRLQSGLNLQGVWINVLDEMQLQLPYIDGRGEKIICLRLLIC